VVERRRSAAAAMRAGSGGEFQQAIVFDDGNIEGIA
jgi:hypothetical protein